MIRDDIKIFLPKFLSDESTQVLFDCLNGFPDNIDSRLYTSYLKDNNVVYQGDGLKELPVVNFVDSKIKKIPSIVMSNTCDIDPSNSRLFVANVLYSPIINLKKYKDQLLRCYPDRGEGINGHIDSIKRQHITQIFYLPENTGIIEESIVFFDRVCNCPNSVIDKNNVEGERLFSLSNYGAYLFLLKLSIHFTRIQDGVDRKH